MMKRKREQEPHQHQHQLGSATCKKHRTSPADKHQQTQFSTPVRFSILKLYYANVCTLGDLLRDWLPLTSRVRRKKLTHFDVDFPQHKGFLDKIVVGYNANTSPETQNLRRGELTSFTQTQRVAQGDSNGQHLCNLSEIVDFVIWSLFRRDAHAIKPPYHLLCRGFQRSSTLRQQDQCPQKEAIPGIVVRVHNVDVAALRQPPWTDLANLLGRDSEGIILNLLLDCSLFQVLETEGHNLYQFSGEPVSRIPTCLTKTTKRRRSDLSRTVTSAVSHPGSVNFVRSRMFHARPSFTREGDVQLGLKHIHILNRCNDLTSGSQDLRVMQYIFPRQFGLHNVFTSKPDPTETVQPLKDYTMREEEILARGAQAMGKTPRRLRGSATRLIKKLRKNFSRCALTQLLRHYCPIIQSSSQRPSSIDVVNPDPDNVSHGLISQPLTESIATIPDVAPQNYSSSFIPHSTPIPQVVAFCKAVVLQLLPRDAFGSGSNGNQNWNKILCSIEQFIRMRRFESTSLHEVSQGINITCIDWLRPPSLQPNTKMAESDSSKRWEILHELIYYIFDSIVIPLVRSNFYVTETGIYRNRLFFFRHDVWKKMVDPCLGSMRLNMFTPVSSRQLRHKFSSTDLGCGHMRLVPKANGVRPIINLRRKAMKIIGGKPILSSSVNSRLIPVFSVLNFETARRPKKLASAMFSVGEIQDRLMHFKQMWTPSQKPFYFVKVDIHSCFDSLPQTELLNFINNFLSEDEYRTVKHAELKPRGGTVNAVAGRAAVKYPTRALLKAENPLLSAETATFLATNKRRTVFVHNDQERKWTRRQLQLLLREHLEQNIVKIGHKHFRQLIGIPQGSILSSLLCNLFYADFERKELHFLDPQSSLLLRLTDDFLLITTDEVQARGFVTAMLHGDAKYGITVNPEKSLVNFEVSIDGCKIPRVHGTQGFPYLGMLIDTQKLQLRKERRDKDTQVENGLSVRRSGRVGTLQFSKTLSDLKRQMSGMLLDGSLNTRVQVMTSIFECFVETGMKMHRYLRNLPKCKRPHQSHLVDLCKQLTEVGFTMVHRARVHRPVQVTKAQMIWLAAAALTKVLVKKQSEYPGVLQWLKDAESKARKSMNMSLSDREQLIRDASQAFEKYVY